MELPPSLIQTSVSSTFLAPTLTYRVLDTTIASTITSNTIQTNPLYVSTLVGSTIQTNTVYGSSTISNNVEIDTLLTYSLAGNTIQTDTMIAANLTGSTIQTNTLYAISLIGSTIQTNTCSASTVSSSTIQVNTFMTSTIAGNIIQSNTYITSTLVGSTIQSNTLKANTLNGTIIQSNTINVSMISSSTFQHNQIHTNILVGSTLSANVFQPTTLQGSTIMAGNIQTTTTNVSTLLLSGSTIQATNFNFNTITGSTIQAHAINISTLLGNTIIGCTIQVNTLSCSTVLGSTIQGNQLNISTLIGSTSQIRQGSVSTIQCSTLTGSTVQTNQCSVSTLSANTIQNNIILVSSLVGGTLQISTLSVSSLTGNMIQTNILQVSTLSGSTIQVNALQVSTFSGSTIQTLQLNVSTLVCSTIQTDRLDGSTILYSTIQANILSVSTIRASTIIGSTIQTNILQVSSLLCSTIIGRNFNTNKILTTNGNKTLATSNIDASNLPYITNLTSQAGGLGQTNTWSSTQTFSAADIYFTGLTTESPSFILGVNASNQMIKFIPTFPMQGTITQNYIPYASGVSTLSNSIIYRVNATDIAIGQTTSAFPMSLRVMDGIKTYGEYITFDLGTGGNYHNRLFNELSGWTTLNQVQFFASNDNNVWESLGIVTSPTTDGSGNYNYTLSNKRYLRIVLLNLYNSYNGGTNSMVLNNPAISRDGGTNLYTDPSQVSLSPNLIQGDWWASWGIKVTNTQYTELGNNGKLGTYTGSNYTEVGGVTTGNLNPYTVSVAGLTQTPDVIAETGTFSKIIMPDKRSGINGLHIPGSNGCTFYMGTMNNAGAGNYTDTLYLNSVPTIDMTDSFNVYNNIVVASLGATSGSGFQTMPSFTPSATGLTFSALIILTGPTMPVQWARIFDMGNLSQAPTRGFNISFNSNGTLHWEYRASDSTLTQANTTIQLALNIMYHVVWTVDTLGNHVLYINGVQAGTMTKVVSLDTYPYFYLGKSNWIADPYPNMTMFDFRMMNRFLSSLDVIGLYYSVKKISGTSILSGQYIILNRTSGEYLNLAEIQVFSYEGGPNIITPSTSVSFPDARADLPASNFVDGDLNTFMHSTGTTNSTVTINLGSTFPIYKIIIYNRIPNCWNRANSIVLTIKNSSNITIYTASPIPDKLGRTTVQTDTGNVTDYYYTFTYFPPYAAVIGDLEKTESSMCKVNVVMFNKGTRGMRIYQGMNQASVNYTSYKDILMTDANSENISLGAGSDTYDITFGPNVTWSSYLKIGAGTNRAAANTAQVISTNGNLHLDCGSNGRALFLNAYTKDSGTGVIYSYTPWTHNSSLTVTGNIYVRWGITTNGWNYITSDKGLYWNSYARGFATSEVVGNSYGTVSTYGTARSGWAGWGCRSKVTLMTDGNVILFHDNTHGWVIWGPDKTDRRILLGGGSVQCSQWWDRFMVFVNGSNTNNGYYYVNQAGGFGGSSDERIKKNIKPIDTEQSITFIRGITPSYFCLKNKPVPHLDASGKETGLMYGVDTCVQSGFIAQNVLESAKNAGLPKSTVSNAYDYEQELSLPEEKRKTLLGLSEIPLVSHSYNALKGTMAKQDSQQTQMDEISNKCSILDTGLTALQEIVRQNAELLQKLMAKTS